MDEPVRVVLATGLIIGVAAAVYAGYLQYVSLPEEHTFAQGGKRLVLGVGGIALIVGGTQMLPRWVGSGVRLSGRTARSASTHAAGVEVFPGGRYAAASGSGGLQGGQRVPGPAPAGVRAVTVAPGASATVPSALPACPRSWPRRCAASRCTRRPPRCSWRRPSAPPAQAA